MAKSKFEKYFNNDMTSEQALHVYVTLLKQVPESDYDELEDAYSSVYNIILKRELEAVERGVMF